MSIMTEKMEEFISKVDLLKLIDLEVCLKYIATNLEKFPIQFLLKKLLEEMNNELLSGKYFENLKN